MAKKILVTDKVADEGLEVLKEKGYEVDVEIGLTHDELIAQIPAYHALIVRSATQVTADVIAAAKNLKVIGRAGVTVSNIDIDAATEAGIIVCNAPMSNIVSAAEQTMCLLLACARETPQANASMKAGKWERSKFLGVELQGKTLAIFGLGRIGGLVAERAKAFGMKLVGYDPYCRRERAEHLGVALYDTVEEVLPLADFITVHLPKTPETIGMFGPDEYAAMKDGVILVNVAAGGIYDVKSLSDFIAAGKIRAAGIDMFEEEPCLASPLHEFDNVILTPRLGASTHEAQVRAGCQIADYVAAGLEGSVVPTALNMAHVPPEVMDVVGPYVPACQMMGRIIAQVLGGLPSTLTVNAAGTLAGADLSFLAAGALSGILTYKNAGAVTPVNAEAMAARHGIAVEMYSTPEAHEYSSVVSLRADGVEVSATLSTVNAQQPRIVSLLGYRMDLAPAQESLVFEYVDAPGRVGIIGTVLGNAGVNITTMQIGTKPEEQCALVYMNVEGNVSEAVIAELREKLPQLKNLWFLNL